MIYTQRDNGGDYLRVRSDKDGSVLRSMIRDELKDCKLEPIVGGQAKASKFLLDLELCTDKIRKSSGTSLGISIPNTLPNTLTDDFDIRTSGGIRLKPENGRIFIRMHADDSKFLNRGKFLGLE